MDIRIDATPNKARLARVALGGALTIYEVTAAKARLLDALGAAGQLDVDVSGVDEIDTAGLQLLVMLKREALRTGKVLRLVDHSMATLHALDALHLASLFGDPVVLSSRANPQRTAPRER